MAPRSPRRRREHWRHTKPLIQRMWIPTPTVIAALEGETKTAHDVELVSRSTAIEQAVWRARVRVPGYDIVHTLRIELERHGHDVYVEDWTGDKLRHTYGACRLCMWYPSDPPEKRWKKSDGLLKLIDTAVLHLFKEYYFREKGEWLGDEVHEAPRKAAAASRPQEGE